jgi:hypothetical protein
MPDLEGLRKNENDLADALLPPDVDLTQPLDARATFLTRGYLVLACATIEEFIEECFDDYTERALDSSSGSVSGCFVFLAIRFADDIGGKSKLSSNLTHRCKALRGLYVSKVVRTNNGVKRDNLRSLARPLGLLDRLESECEELLSPADTLGARRGAVAHTGTVNEELRPAEARKLVSDVLDELPLLLTLLDL